MKQRSKAATLAYVIRDLAIIVLMTLLVGMTIVQCTPQIP